MQELISREDVINILTKAMEDMDTDYAMQLAIDKVRRMPGVAINNNALYCDNVADDSNNCISKEKLNELWDAVDPTWKKKTIKGRYGGDKIDFG